jgi:hypothetical protein
MTNISNTSLRRIFVIGLSLAIAPCVGLHAETVQQIPGPSGHTVWKITEPNVKQPRTEYPQIVFQPRSWVTVDAEGCVQTGGIGETWKRYAAPAGSNANIYYRGQIFIPGTGMTTLQPVLGRQPQTYTIPASAVMAPGQNHLALGYTDDNFGDNGYGSHDNGTSNQCMDIGAVSITVDIEPLPAAQPAPVSAAYVLTLESVTVRRTRSANADTNFLGAAVMVNGTMAPGVASQPLGDWKQGAHTLNFPILVTEVAPNDRVAIGYTIANAGHGNEQQISDAIVGVVSSLGNSVPVVGGFLSAAANVWQQVFKVADPDCDGLVVADSIPATGTDLATWTQFGDVHRTFLVPGTESATGCGSNSYYEVTYSVARAPAGTGTPFSLSVPLRSRVLRVGPSVKLLKLQ